MARVARKVAVFVLCAAAPSVYWYVRNWTVGGSPVFPAGVFVRSETLELLRPDSWHSSFWGCGDPLIIISYLGAVVNECGGFHAACIVLSPFVATCACTVAVVQRLSAAGISNRVRMHGVISLVATKGNVLAHRGIIIERLMDQALLMATRSIAASEIR